ncbi:hypothetical protein ACG33_01330 [Steroidobacter denitrificans]|uniref:Uncharacterized protein n=1 Tax=Steroidobacter denitrificans TaxID=465721 RepID=A0A127F830_STEDE|nr:hypothetical protein [Steroidobacter denitrificans]AMN45768.1 hypothetical protein ACG33_01330 [Steroidobacter denitrificans]
MTLIMASLILPIMSLGGCSTARGYEGGQRAAGEVARISGDFRVTAGAPLSVILRQVDEQVLSVGERSVDVLPGEHRLLVDCRIAETGSVSRHALDVTVLPGRRYKLRAELAPGLRECTAVILAPVH